MKRDRCRKRPGVSRPSDAVDQRDDARVVGAVEFFEKPADFRLVEGFDVREFAEEALAAVFRVWLARGFLGGGFLEGGLGDERGIEAGRQAFGGGGGVRAGVVELEVEAADEFAERGVGVLPVIEQELAVFEDGEAGGGNRVLLALGGGFPLGEGLQELVVAAGELVVEGGVEIRVAGAGNEFGQGGACGWRDRRSVRGRYRHRQREGCRRRSRQIRAFLMGET